MVYIVMGVSASGKSTIAKMLSRKLKIKYIEADDFHSDANKDKMRNAIPLTDEDRFPWLHSLHLEVLKFIKKDESVVLACSALKQSYRKILSNGMESQVQLIYLKGSFDVLYNRIKNRKGHYMPPELLQSQFDTLEEPEDAITASVDGTPKETLTHILKQLPYGV